MKEKIIQKYRIILAACVFIMLTPMIIHYTIKKENEAVSHNVICDTTMVAERENTIFTSVIDGDTITYNQEWYYCESHQIMSVQSIRDSFRTKVVVDYWGGDKVIFYVDAPWECVRKIPSSVYEVRFQVYGPKYIQNLYVLFK